MHAVLSTRIYKIEATHPKYAER